MPTQTAQQLSARNQFSGTVSNIKEGTVMAEVTVMVQGISFVAAITAESVRAMRLAANDRVTVAIKATEVLVAK
ncbi:MAG TPA: TOBE domain-containing protein [Nitrospira sp.]|nr:TOBE domain-containing protein [Nitrospira sp.]